MSMSEQVSAIAPRPGEYPYTAGLHPGGYTTRLWTMRQLAGLGDAAATNERFRYLLGLGESGLSVAFDLPTQMGLDPDDPRALGEVGRVGVSVATVDEFAALFEGIPLDRVTVSFTINATAPMLLAMWIVCAQERGIDPAALRGTIQNEILKEFLARKATVFPLDPSFRFSVDVLQHCIRHMPHVKPISVSGGHAREAGAERELEVACAIADADEYLRAAAERGLGVDEVGPQMSFIFGTHVQLLAEAAKLRAARRLFATRMRERWGAENPRSTMMRIQVNTFGSALAAQEPLDNIARVTMQAIAAVLGGVQSLHTCSFDEAHCTPGSLGARVALRTQQILAEETDLSQHVDPLGGSEVVERLTDEIEAKAQRWLDEIELRGGMLECIRSGWLESVIEEHAWRDRGPVVGVSDPDRSPTEDALLGSTSSRGAFVGRSVDRGRAAAELAAVRQAVARNETVMPSLIAAVKARATLGEMRAAMDDGILDAERGAQ
jgi:methylmalonyl-CoA mutase N-terminal domain/subunit